VTKLNRRQKAVKDELRNMSGYLTKYNDEQITRLYCETYNDFITPEMKDAYKYGVMSMSADMDDNNYRKWLYRKIFEFKFNQII